MTPRTYASPEAFKQALEQRLRSSAKTGAEFARKRQLLVFDRFLARIVAVLGDAATLKGGLVLELRLERARTTKDVDLRMVGSPDDVLAKLQEAGRQNLGDFMAFEVGPDDDHPEIQNDGMQYDGLRFRAECKLAGKLYGQPFGVDVAFGDPILGEPEVVVAEDVLAFAGIAPPTLRLYPIETHIAEKLHAYTMLHRRRGDARARTRQQRFSLGTRDQRAFTQNGQALDEVAQLAHVAGVVPRDEALGGRLEKAESFADVLPRLGEMTWARAMGLEACDAISEFLVKFTKTRVVVDPFCGVGTMLASANQHGLDAIGVELSAKRAEKARTLTLGRTTAKVPPDA